MEKRTYLFFLGIFLLVSSVKGQSIERSVIGSSGGSYFDGVNFEVDYTLGEFAILTMNNSNNILTQGFQQPFLDSWINVMENSENGISISYYPNPTNANLTLSISNSSNREFSIGLYDILGQCIHQQTIVSKFDGFLKMEIDMRSCATGNYYMRITSGNDFNKTYKISKISN